MTDPAGVDDDSLGVRLGERFDTAETDTAAATDDEIDAGA